MKLEEMLSKERIAISVQAEDWEAAVRAVGKLMFDTGVVEARYIDGMVNTTKELGPYIVIAPGVAIPHSRPEDGVISPCMAFVKLASPVEFGNKENDPVHLLFALGALDHEQHVDALRQIAEVLMDEKKSKKLFEAGSIQDITGVLYS